MFCISANIQKTCRDLFCISGKRLAETLCYALESHVPTMKPFGLCRLSLIGCLRRGSCGELRAPGIAQGSGRVWFFYFARRVWVPFSRLTRKSSHGPAEAAGRPRGRVCIFRGPAGLGRVCFFRGRDRVCFFRGPAAKNPVTTRPGHLAGPGGRVCLFFSRAGWLGSCMFIFFAAGSCMFFSRGIVYVFFAGGVVTGFIFRGSAK